MELTLIGLYRIKLIQLLLIAKAVMLNSSYITNTMKTLKAQFVYTNYLIQKQTIQLKHNLKLILNILYLMIINVNLLKNKSLDHSFNSTITCNYFSLFVVLLSGNKSSTSLIIKQLEKITVEYSEIINTILTQHKLKVINTKKN